MERLILPFAFFQALLERGSYPIFFLLLISAGLGAPVAEELVVLTAGAFSREGFTIWWIAFAVCYLGVVVGDVILFLTARKLGGAAFRHPRFQKLLPPERLEKLQDFYRRRGGLAVFVGRHIPGVRSPLFALAGINRMDLKRFIFWDALSACINTPLVFWLGWTFSDRLERLHDQLTHVEHWVILALIVGFAIYTAYSFWRSTNGHPIQEARRRLSHRKAR